MNKKILSKDQPLEPHIECDGGYYAVCVNCWTELAPRESPCPHCSQAQDWSWFGKGTINKLNKDK